MKRKPQFALASLLGVSLLAPFAWGQEAAVAADPSAPADVVTPAEAAPAAATSGVDSPMAGSATMPEEQTDRLDAVPDGDAIPGGSAEEGDGYAIRSLLQTRYAQTWANGGGLLDRAATTGNDGYRLERGFLRFTDDPSKQVGVKILFDLAELTRKNTKRSVKLAYVRLRPLKRLEFTFGIQKRPFSLLELNPIASYELADVGVIDDLIKDLEFGGRDVGAMARFEPLEKRKWLRIFVGAFRGQAEGRDASPAGVLSGRVTTKPSGHVEVGADVAWHPTQTEVIDKGVAVSGDVNVKFGGLSVRAEGLWGTRDDLVSRLQARHFLGTWALAAYQIPMGKFILMPAGRAEWIDLDRGNAGGAVTSFTGALNLLLPQGVRLLIDATHHSAQTGAYRSDGTAYLDSWTLVTQVQLLI